MKIESRLVFTKDREWGVTANRYGVSFGDDENVLELESGDRYTTS